MDKTQLNNALIPSLALPQQIQVVPTRSIQTQQNVYDPNDIIAMRKAMQERNKIGALESLSNALGSIEPKTYKGAYGVEEVNPFVSGLAGALKGFDKVYSSRKEAERKLADDEFELAKMMAEANKQAITTQVKEDVQKVNVPADQTEQKGTMQSAIKTLEDLSNAENLTFWDRARAGIGIGSTDTRLAQGQLSSAIAGIAPVAIQKLKSAGVSGINSLPEFMTYVGLPENATNEQIKGALPLIKQIVGYEEPVAQGQTPEQQAEQQAVKDFMMGTI